MNKLEEAEAMANEMECDYNVAFCEVYDVVGDPYSEETDDAL